MMYGGLMNVTQKQLPDDVDALKEIIANLTNEYENRIKNLEEEKKLLLHRLFGRKSEKLTAEDVLQGRLFDEAESDDNDSIEDIPSTSVTTVKEHKRRKPGRKPLPESLPRVNIVHDIAESEKQCACGCQMSRIGEDISERLDIIPAKIQVHRHIRYKYACKNCEGIESDGVVKTAPLPPQMVPQGIVSSGLLAWVMVSKFCDALPFYRQEKLFSRIGVDISRATFCNWSIVTHRGSERMLELMWRDILASQLVGMDETPVQVMKEPGRKNTTKSYMWVFRGGEESRPVIMFRYAPTRGSEFINSEFADYEGIIQTDGYQGYNALGKKEKVTHAVCWTHVRRKFMEAMQGTSQSLSHSIVSMIKMLYDVETKYVRKNITMKRL